MRIQEWMTEDKLTRNAIYFRKEFTLENCQKAILKITALGWFKVFVNGQTVTDEEFLPGWTDYTKRVPLLKYDITDQLKANNAIGVIVGDGWARGETEFGELKKYYDVESPCLYAVIDWIDVYGMKHIEEQQGWKFGYGAIRRNDIYAGEVQDHTHDSTGFSCAGFDDSEWKDVKKIHRDIYAETENLPKVSVHEVLQGKLIKKEEGKYLFDFQQNFAGVTRIDLKVLSKAVLTVRHGEILTEEGGLYVDNLRGASAQDQYILPEGKYNLRPQFTYHGFRYAEISCDGEVEINKCEGLAIYTNSQITGSFNTSLSLFNKIMQNSLWGMKSNVMYIPTDCPQRDERLGWLGDVGVIARSLMYQFDCRTVLAHYLSVIQEAIREDGAIPCIAPNARGFLDNAIGASGWADAFISLIHDYYDFYGDKTIIEKYFSDAERFMEWIDKNSVEYRRNTYCFSDWLSIHADLKEGYGDVDFQLFDLYFYVMDCLYMAKFCRILGKSPTIYEKKYEQAKQYFEKHLCVKGTPIGQGRQTALLLAYKTGLLSGKQIETELIADVESKGLTCGFIGVKYLLPALTELGRADIAYKLIANEKYPSWGYSIANGATTIWERWDSYTRENGMNSHGMNSLNHFAFGSCVEWYYTYVLGITPLKAGFEEIMIKPYIDTTGILTYAEGSYLTKHGNIFVKWCVQERQAIVTVEAPKEIKCVIDIPGMMIKEHEIEGAKQRICVQFHNG